MSSSTIAGPLVRSSVLNPESWLAALFVPIKGGIRWIGTRRRMRRDIEELKALDDRLLRDIGLSRSEVEYAVRFGRLPTGIDRHR
jgi:uncharacterized protein YjiS (DUF1127 family)